jgi:hypothetical protein
LDHGNDDPNRKLSESLSRILPGDLTRENRKKKGKEDF